MAPAHIPVFLSQKTSTKIGINRPAILFLAWLADAHDWHLQLMLDDSRRGRVAVGRCDSLEEANAGLTEARAGAAMLSLSTNGNTKWVQMMFH